MEYEVVYNELRRLRNEAGFDVSFRKEDAEEISKGLDLLPQRPIGFEIGSHNGASSFFMCKYRPDLTLYSLDEKPQEKWRKNMEGLRAVQLQGNSGTYFIDEKFDLLFIDGGHDYEQVKRDLSRWVPRVKDNGIIAGHDYEIEGVWRAVEEQLYRKYKKIVANHSFVYQKCSP